MSRYLPCQTFVIFSRLFGEMSVLIAREMKRPERFKPRSVHILTVSALGGEATVARELSFTLNS